MYMQQGLHSEGTAAVEIAVASAPRNHFLRWALLYGHMQGGQYAEAAHSADQYLKMIDREKLAVDQAKDMLHNDMTTTNAELVVGKKNKEKHREAEANAYALLVSLSRSGGGGGGRGGREWRE
jgi:hypothetical protein